MSKKLGMDNPLVNNALFGGVPEETVEKAAEKKPAEKKPAEKKPASKKKEPARRVEETGDKKYNFATGPIPKKETKTRRIQATCIPSLYEALLDVARKANDNPDLSFNEALSMAMSEYVMNHQDE